MISSKNEQQQKDDSPEALENLDLENLNKISLSAAKTQPDENCRITRSKYKEPIEPQSHFVKRRRIDEQRSQIKSSQTKPQRKRIRQIRKCSMLLCLPPSLRPYEMVWAHIKGYPFWPGIIEEETPKGRYKIHFFGDYTSCDVTKNKIMHMMEGFNKFSTVEVRNISLNKAINEAKYFVLEPNRETCPICDMLLLKANSK